MLCCYWFAIYTGLSIIFCTHHSVNETFFESFIKVTPHKRIQCWPTSCSWVFPRCRCRPTCPLKRWPTLLLCVVLHLVTELQQKSETHRTI